MTLSLPNLRQTLAFKSITVALALTLSACGTGSDQGSVNNMLDTTSGTNSTPTTDNGGSSSINEFEQALDDLIHQYNLPAAGGMLIHNGEVLEMGVAGVRNANHQVAVQSEDRWHLGSITKSMTATLAGRLVEADLIRWDSRLNELFPEFTANAQPQFGDITLSQLLSHTSGLPRDVDWEHYRDNDKTPTKLRLEVLQDALHSQTIASAGQFSYSNLGYVIAGAMLEQVSGKSWETLMQEEVFAPLQIAEAGFGAPTGISSQPSGHWLNNDGSFTAIAGELPESDNPPVIGPAGTINMSLTALAKYVTAHMVGELGESTLLSAETFHFLHSQVGNTGYGMGWFIDEQNFRHDGSNRLWFARVGISTQQQIAAISVTNIGGDNASVATDTIINTMLAQHFN